jgi:hypothetical protein
MNKIDLINFIKNTLDLSKHELLTLTKNIELNTNIINYYSLHKSELINFFNDDFDDNLVNRYNNNLVIQDWNFIQRKTKKWINIKDISGHLVAATYLYKNLKEECLLEEEVLKLLPPVENFKTNQVIKFSYIYTKNYCKNSYYIAVYE